MCRYVSTLPPTPWTKKNGGREPTAGSEPGIPARLPSIPAQDGGQLLDSRRLEERRQRKLDLRACSMRVNSCKARMEWPPSSEEVVPHADGADAKYFLPNGGELVSSGSRGATKPSSPSGAHRPVWVANDGRLCRWVSRQRLQVTKAAGII